jgi:outer membrane immunogenic protein
MRIIHLAPLGAAMSLALVTPALAQDAGGDEWTGPYVGGSIGYNWQPNSNKNRNETLQFDTDGDGSFDDTVVTATGANAFSPGFCDGKRGGPTVCDRGDRDGKLAWGVHAGYDMQMGNFVVGAVVEGGKSYGSNYVTGFSTTPASYTFVRKLEWEAAARLRAGFAMGKTLVYGTGGLAYGKFENRFLTTNQANTFSGLDRKQDDWGYTYGGGIEHKVSDNFSIGVLYRRTQFNPNDGIVTVTRGTAPATNPFVNPDTTAGRTDIRRSNNDYVNQSVRATASFRF